MPSLSQMIERPAVLQPSFRATLNPPLKYYEILITNYYIRYIITVLYAKQVVSRQHAIPNSNGFCGLWVLVPCAAFQSAPAGHNQGHARPMGKIKARRLNCWSNLGPVIFTPLPSANSRPSKNRGPGKKCPETSQARTPKKNQGRPGLLKA